MMGLFSKKYNDELINYYNEKIINYDKKLMKLSNKLYKIEELVNKKGIGEIKTYEEFYILLIKELNKGDIYDNN